MTSEFVDSPSDPSLTAKSPDKSGKTGSNTGAEPDIRNEKGRFLPGNTANPKGRPKGKLNHATLFARALLEEAAPEVARRAIAEAKKGKAVALKLVLERLIPTVSDRRLELTRLAPHPHDLPSGTLNPESLLLAHDELLRAVAEGEVSPLEARALSQLIEARRRSWEALELHQRLENVEQRLAEARTRERQKG
jgi:hypothetical protein